MNASVKQSLNAGELLSQVVSVVFRNFPILLLVSVVPNFLIILLYTELLILVDQSTGSFSSAQSLIDSMLMLILIVAVGLISYIVAKSLVLLVAKDLIFKTRIEPMRYLITLIRTLPVMFVTSLVVFAFAFVIPFALLFFELMQNFNLPLLDIAVAIFALILCIYILARFWVFMPAILIGGDGIRSVYQASALSKEHRWPIAGCLLVLFVIGYAVIFGIIYFAGLMFQIDLISAFFVSGSFSPTTLGTNTFVGTISTMLDASFSVLLYSRLRELKEGLGLTDIATVFE